MKQKQKVDLSFYVELSGVDVKRIRLEHNDAAQSSHQRLRKDKKNLNNIQLEHNYAKGMDSTPLATHPPIQ